MQLCIIPAWGKLQSRAIGEVLHEAERLVRRGPELLVISQDTSAYGVDLHHRTDEWHGRIWRSHIYDLARGLGELRVWVRLHYVYPYPHVDDLIPLMAEGSVPALSRHTVPAREPPDPQAHAPPRRRPRTRSDASRRGARCVRRSRCAVPSVSPESETDFEVLLDFLSVAQLDRAGCFQYFPVDAAKANDLPDPVPPDIKEARYHRLMQTQLRISRERLRAKIGQRMEILVEEVANGQATARSFADAPEIDGKGPHPRSGRPARGRPLPAAGRGDRRL